LRAIGQALAATHLIEGSVRKAGNRLRITAQLIKADDGTHIWAEDYDRDLTDIFAVQEDIARAITTSLRMPLGLKPGENLINNRAIDPESYENFLRAKVLIDDRMAQNYPQAVSLLENVVSKNPGFAPAWAWLGAGRFFLLQQHLANFRETAAEARCKARNPARSQYGAGVHDTEAFHLESRQTG
jgi:hypothetical protein